LLFAHAIAAAFIFWVLKEGNYSVRMH